MKFSLLKDINNNANRKCEFSLKLYINSSYFLFLIAEICSTNSSGLELFVGWFLPKKKYKILFNDNFYDFPLHFCAFLAFHVLWTIFIVRSKEDHGYNDNDDGDDDDDDDRRC